jgi:hypothetical protein
MSPSSAGQWPLQIDSRSAMRPSALSRGQADVAACSKLADPHGVCGKLANCLFGARLFFLPYVAAPHRVRALAWLRMNSLPVYSG